MSPLARARDGRVLELALDAPERRNALDRAMLEELARALADAEESIAKGDADAPRAIVLRGAGEKAFSAGYDIGELVQELASGPSVQDAANHPLERALERLERCPVPTIALVHGHAFGAGLELAVTCDLRVAADDARLCMPPAKLGLLYSASGIRRFLDLCGASATKELFFTGEPVDAARAQALGLVTRVVAKKDATESARALARTIAANAPLSIRHTKRVIRMLEPPPLGEKQLELIARLREECFRSADFAAAAQAFIAKKKGPIEFEGR